jgi:endonuclease/exonuclease/phosphatase (EEP) superfamily protein YafD
MIGRVLAGIAFVAATIGLVGQFGRVSDAADIANFVAPWWLAIGALAGAAALFSAESRRLAGLSLAALGIVAALLLGGALLASQQARDCSGATLRLVQFNLFADNPDLRPAAAWIAGTDADVVLIEEVEQGSPIVPALRAHYPYAVSCLPHLRCSTLILSRHPFLASGGLAKDDPENRKGLSAAWAMLPGPGGPFTIVAAHLARPWPWAGQARDRADLVRFVATRDRASLIMAGDFNLPAWTFQMRRFAEALGLGRLTAIASWPVTKFAPPALAIDHVFAGRDWSAERIERGPVLGSDHYPLLSTLRRCT